ncbi:MAG TPA: hypothetical protein VK760_06905 [Candidatus Acidoferrales bacterium]|jgi:hypothetical protein|nr:hypothetical protein [Candidatus Acidoferrales bacterium]
MKRDAIEPATEQRAAPEEEAIYRHGLCRNWALRYGQRPDSLSRLSAFTDGAVLLAAAAAAGLHAFGPAIGIAVLGLIASHAMNRSFLKVERGAFADVEREATGGAFVRNRSQASPFYALAKVAVKPRVRAKNAWVEKRMELFLSRRAHKQRQAEIFEKQTIKLGSIHGTLDARRAETLGLDSSGVVPGGG